MSKFSLKRKSEVLTFETENGDIEFTLKEMSAARRDSYLQKLQARVELNEDGSAKGVSNFVGLQAELIHESLEDKGGSPLPLEDIQEWPANVVAAVYEKCQVFNGLNKTPELAEKNG